jgi:DnaJ-class molecular chaperone
VAGLAPAEIRALATLLDELDYYQLLEIDRDAPASAVKRGYYAATRRFHPDANRHLSGGDRAALEGIAKRVSEAYQVLRDPRRRKAYDGQLSQTDGTRRIQLAAADAEASRQAVEDHLGRTPNGRRFFNLARSDIDRGDLSSAARNLKMALTFEPQNDYFKKKLAEVNGANRR